MPDLPAPTPGRPPRDNLVRALSQPPELVRAKREGDASSTSDAMPLMRGHFAVFNRWTEINSWWEGEFMERIAPGAFKKTFRENRDGMKALFQHGQDFQVGDKPLGPIRELREDAEGGYYEVQLLDTSYCRDILPGLEAGLYGASFRFRVMKEEVVQNPKVSADNPRGIPERTIKEAQVIEFGPVTFPAYQEASAGVRSDSVRSLTDTFILGQFTRDPDKLRELLEAQRASSNRNAEPPKADALPNEGAGDDPTPDEGSRGQEPQAEPATAPPTPAPAVDNKENRQMPPASTMTIDERRQRQDAITARFQEIHAEHGASVLPDDIRSEWEGLVAERDENQRAIRDYERRSRELSLMAGDESRHEPANAGSHAPATRGSKRVPANVFALEEYRSLSSSMPDLRQAFRDGAMSIVERSAFAHPDADEAKSRARIQRLLDTRDTEDGAFAQRIIATSSPTYQRAFGKTLKGSPLSADEQRALSLGSDPDGGFAVPVQLDPTVILTSNGVVNPLRSFSRIETIVGKEWQGVTSEGITVTRAAESDEATDDAPTLDQPTVRTNRVQGFIPFSVELGQDWSALQSEMAVLLSDAKDVEESSSFLLGNGVGVNASGIIGTLAAGSEVTTITNDAFAVGDVYKLEEALPPRFRARARFLANRAIYNKVRQFDTSGGASLWVRLIDGLGNELVGYPAHEASGMASAIADAAKILLIGDFRHFLIVDRVGMSIELIPHLFGANGRPTGQRGIYAVWRNNSVILVDNAFRILKVQ